MDPVVFTCQVFKLIWVWRRWKGRYWQTLERPNFLAFQTWTIPRRSSRSRWQYLGPQGRYLPGRGNHFRLEQSPGEAPDSFNSVQSSSRTPDTGGRERKRYLFLLLICRGCTVCSAHSHKWACPLIELSPEPEALRLVKTFPKRESSRNNNFARHLMKRPCLIILVSPKTKTYYRWVNSALIKTLKSEKTFLF